MIKSLEEILKYENKHVLKRFKQFRPDAAEEADMIFDDLKRFLWLVANQLEQKEKGLEVPDLSFAHNMSIIDEMWHAFILWTEMYTEFCEKYFGKYIHHPTDMPVYFQNVKVDGMEEEKAGDIFLSGMIAVVIGSLGEEVAQRWFSYYEKYPSSGIH